MLGGRRSGRVPFEWRGRRPPGTRTGHMNSTPERVIAVNSVAMIAFGLQFGHLCQVDEVDFAIVLEFEERQDFPIFRRRVDAEEFLRPRFPDRHRRQQFLDVGGLEEFLGDAQLRQVERIVADRILDQFRFVVVLHESLLCGARPRSRLH